MSSTSVIVFGATGAVGSSTARTAAQKGAKVFLGMRDTSKPIPGLSAEEEKKGGFERVTADLTDVTSIGAALAKTGAKVAFIYHMWTVEDGMRASAEALKAGGIEFVILLSTDSMEPADVDLHKVPASFVIPHRHAQVEITLREVFGPTGYTAVRPGYFDSNVLRWGPMLAAGEVYIAYPEATFDWISPEDIGKVIGSLAASKGPHPHQPYIRILGPQVMSQAEAIGVIGKVLGKELKVVPISGEASIAGAVAAGVPEFLAQDLVFMCKGRVDGTFGATLYEGAGYEEAAANLRKYVGQSQTLAQWVEANKDKFPA